MLVQLQTLRGNAGTAIATTTVETAIAAYNDSNKLTGKDAHVGVGFVALPPNVKGMQVHLSLLAALARRHSCTLIRLSVHNGNVILCGTAANVATVQAAHLPTYNAMVTAAAAAYVPATHGPRMGFTNAYLCGVTGGIAASAPPAVLAYGLGFLHTFPAPGKPETYALGVKAAATIAPPADGKARKTA